MFRRIRLEDFLWPPEPRQQPDGLTGLIGTPPLKQ
jgi:hypothetical protein